MIRSHWWWQYIHLLLHALLPWFFFCDNSNVVILLNSNLTWPRFVDGRISAWFGGALEFRLSAYLGYVSRVSVWHLVSVLTVFVVDVHVKGTACGVWYECMTRTRLSNTHLLSFHSAGRHCHNCWLLSSRQVQCFLNSSRQCLLTSSRLRNSEISFWVNGRYNLACDFLHIAQMLPQSIYLSHPQSLSCTTSDPLLPIELKSCLCKSYLHALSTPGDPPSLLQAIQLSPSWVLGLALHEIIIISLASCSDEEARGQ